MSNDLKILCSLCQCPSTATIHEKVEAFLKDDGLFSIAGTIEIQCSNCKGIVYKKLI